MKTMSPGRTESGEPNEVWEEPPIRVIGARELLGTRGVLRIELDGELYTLRLTRNQRLILTK
ncbi:MAG TPA: hemin uptake protein HemP [Myxococcota bacterium]|nr:hemin uptake protein HemP [Myxococcota bacterium]